jgi:UDP-glucose 4-epimerase
LFHEVGDVAHDGRIREIIEKHSVTGILHLAFGGPFPPSGDAITDTTVGLTSLLSIFRIAIEQDIRRIVTASTIGVYADATVDGPATEDLPLPLTATHPIPAMKKLGEMLSIQVAAMTGLNVYNARIAGVWGPGGRPDPRFFGAAQLIHAAAAGKAPDFSDLLVRPQRADGLDLIYAPDCGTALARLQLAPSLQRSVYNVGSGRATTYGELADATEAVVPGFVPSIAPGGSGRSTVLDISRLRADTGFEPAWTTDAAVRDYIDWLRAGNER